MIPVWTKMVFAVAVITGWFVCLLWLVLSVAQIATDTTSSCTVAVAAATGGLRC